MEIDETVKGHSNFVIGILIVSVTSILAAFALGIWGIQFFSHDQVDPIGLGLSSSVESSTPELDTSKVDNLVSVAKGGCMEMDTEPGTIEIDYAESVLPDWAVLPLCITNDMLSNYHVSLRVTGGYTPYCGCITFTQEEVEVGKICLDFGTPVHEPCYTDIYTVTFSTTDDIELKSNQWPSTIPDGFSIDPCGDIENHKKVTVCLDTCWSGCHFWLILTQHFYFWSPPAPNEYPIFIASLLK